MMHIYREIVTRTIYTQAHHAMEQCYAQPQNPTLSLTLENQRTGLTRIGAQDSNEIVNTKQRWSAIVDRHRLDRPPT